MNGMLINVNFCILIHTLHEITRELNGGLPTHLALVSGRRASNREMVVAVRVSRFDVAARSPAVGEIEGEIGGVGIIICNKRTFEKKRKTIKTCYKKGCILEIFMFV